jgi:acetyl-CoA carboxylase biotin carboxyl carrier protein
MGPRLRAARSQRRTRGCLTPQDSFFATPLRCTFKGAHIELPFFFSASRDADGALADCRRALSNARAIGIPGRQRMAKSVSSPVSGLVISCLVKVGDTVAPDTEVAIVEAMKMHIPVSAEAAGRVAQWLVGEQTMVTEGQALLTLES